MPERNHHWLDVEEGVVWCGEVVKMKLWDTLVKALHVSEVMFDGPMHIIRLAYRMALFLSLSHPFLRLMPL